MKRLLLLLAIALPTLAAGQIFWNGPKLDAPPVFAEGDFDRWIDSLVAFPEEALRDGITGVVKMTFAVSPNGNGYRDKIESSPHEALSRELGKAVNSSRWSPAMLGGKTVRATATYSYDFSRKFSPEQLAAVTVAYDHTPPYFWASDKKKTVDGFIVWLQDACKIPKKFKKKDYRFATRVSFTVEADNSLTDIVIAGCDNDDLRGQLTHIVEHSR
ncbi:MAG: TonB family protein [Rikenellaceae bacterium]|jgi:TonB family protein|nr:TonB family protein [Rikenellaceae bacterium]